MKPAGVYLIVGIFLLIVGLTVIVLWVFSQDAGDHNEYNNHTVITPALTTTANLPPLAIGSATLQTGALANGFLVPYPAPNSILSVTDYNRGMLQTIENYKTQSFNICIYTEVLRGEDNKFCGNPPGFTFTPNPNCHTLAYLKGTDFRPYIHFYLDDDLISGGRLGADNTAEIRGLIESDAYIMCYRIPLESGVHTMRYVFEYEPENIVNTNEWSFTLTP